MTRDTLRRWRRRTAETLALWALRIADRDSRLLVAESLAYWERINLAPSERPVECPTCGNTGRPSRLGDPLNLGCWTCGRSTKRTT